MSDSNFEAFLSRFPGKTRNEIERYVGARINAIMSEAMAAAYAFEMRRMRSAMLVARLRQTAAPTVRPA